MFVGAATQWLPAQEAAAPPIPHWFCKRCGGTFLGATDWKLHSALAYGAALGYAVVLLLRSIDSYAVEIMNTIALSTAGYAVAELLHVSAPISVVVMGLVIGNHGRKYSMSDRTREQLFSFWELADDLLNLLLFGLIGLELVALARSEVEFIAVALLAVPIVLLARWICVALPITALSVFRRFERNTLRILTWAD